MQKCVIHREIGIDVGHRVPDHGSKCRNPHGHRYTVIATCEGPVMDQIGHEENGMVLDFGNIKKYMMDFIDSIFDHGFVVCVNDAAMMNMFFPNQNHQDVINMQNQVLQEELTEYHNVVMGLVDQTTFSIELPRTCKSEQDPDGMKVIVTDFVPTAENLAKFMFDLLQKPISWHYGDQTIKLVNIRLYETPNGYVDYPGMMYA